MSNLVSLLAAGGGTGLGTVTGDVSNDFFLMNNCLGSLSSGITFGFSFDSLFSVSTSGDLGVGEAGVSSISGSGDIGVSSCVT